jgi:integration host factor subunit beta
MTKADLIEEVSRVAEIKSKEAEVVVDTILASIVETVRGGGKVEVRRFGSFRTRKRSGRAARNPATGDPVTVPPKDIAFFKPSKEVLELINRPRRSS